jgi:hypothetical protein
LGTHLGKPQATFLLSKAQDGEENRGKESAGENSHACAFVSDSPQPCPIFLLNSLNQLFFFFMVLGFEFRVLHLLSRCLPP